MTDAADATPDTSVVVAGLCSWHPDHHLARPFLALRLTPIAHVLAESYSVLTRLPGSRRIEPEVVVQALQRAFPLPPLSLPPDAMMPLLGQLAYEGIFGGAMYDALIGCTAQKAGVQLVTLDARARRTYDAVGAQTLMLAS